MFEVDSEEGPAYLTLGHQADLRLGDVRHRCFHLDGVQGEPRLRCHPAGRAVGQQAERAPGQHAGDLRQRMGGELRRPHSVCSSIFMHKASKSRPATRAAIGTRLWSVMPGEVFTSSR